MKQLPYIDVLKPSLDSTKKALIVFNSTPNLDIVASSLGLALTLEKKGIDVQVVSLSEMRVEFSRLVGVDQVRKKVGNRNLVISFDYQEDQVEKVSYNISEDGKRFNLVISPKTAAKPLDPQTVEFDLNGVEADFIIYVGVSSYAELGDLYEANHLIFDSAMSLSLTLFPNQVFAKYQIDAQGLSSISELAFQLCSQLRLELDQDSASNMIAGIDAVTQGFTSSLTTADTFEAIADLMRAGGKRQPLSGNNTLTHNQMPFTPQRQFTTSNQTVSNDKFAQLLGATQQQQSVLPANE